MDISKQRRFNEKMGKVQKLSKGGLIKRVGDKKYFAQGGLASGISGGLGLNNNFQAQGAQINPGTNAGQLDTAYQGTQGALANQTNLVAQTQPGTQQGLATQNALTGQLQGVINGTGPNAAQAALNQNTAANVANQAALMAGQRGASQNVGLAARQNAMTGAATQQAAVGQGATLQAQQQIAAQQQLANLASTQYGQGAGAVEGQNNAQQNEQNILQGANTAANNANVAMQSNINNVNAGVASGNQQQASSVFSGIANLGSSVAGLGGLFAKGGEVMDHHCAGGKCTDRAHYAHMMAEGGMLPVAQVPASVAALPGAKPWLQSQVATAGPQIQGASQAQSADSSPFLQGATDQINAKNAAQATQNKESAADDAFYQPGLAGGISENKAMGGPVGGGSSGISSLASLAPLIAMAAKGGKICDGPHDSHVANFLASGGKVPAMVSPGERYLNPEDVRKVVEDGENPLKIGMKIPGKAKVKGDSLKNDTVKASLEEGGVVVPRDIMNKKSRDHAELFVRRAVHMKAPKEGK